MKEKIKKHFQIAAAQAEIYLLYKQGAIKYSTFVLIYKALEKENELMEPMDLMINENWIVEQEQNELPVSSSGSTFSAITDFDNLVALFEEYADEHEDEVYDLWKEILGPVTNKGYNFRYT